MRSDKFTWSKDDVEFEPKSGTGKPLVRPEDREQAKTVVQEAERRRLEDRFTYKPGDLELVDISDGPSMSKVEAERRKQRDEREQDRETRPQL